MDDREAVSHGGEQTRRTGQAVSVKDRVAALEAAAEADLRDSNPVQVVYPLHYKRFVRRTSSAIRPNSPDHVIYAPKPTRSIPILRTPPETPLRPPPGGSVGSPNARPESAQAPAAIAPPSFLHGTRGSCFRHGRHHKPIDSMAKSRTGVYIPTGPISRRQVDINSPWARPRPIAREQHAGDPQNSACPDCVQELRIKRREFCHDNIRSAPNTANNPPQASSVPELLGMIDQAANEIHTNTGKIAEHYANRRDVGAEARHSLLSGSEFDHVVHQDKRAEQALVGRQSIDEQYRTLHDMLSNAQPKKPLQTPPPAAPALHHVPELADVLKIPPAATSAAPTPSVAPKTHHGFLSGFLNPFHHKPAARSASPNLPSQDTHSAPQPSGPPQAVVARTDSPDATTPQPISANPNPYHHAPHTPLDTREHQRVIRTAMQMDTPQRGKDAMAVAAAAERAARRTSLAKGAARKGWFG